MSVQLLNHADAIRREVAPRIALKRKSALEPVINFEGCRERVKW
jgi:hypothetical protein